MKNLSCQLIVSMFACFVLCFAGCTANERARSFGGSETINVPVDQKVIDVTWKQDAIWYATRPMRADEKPETVTFHQKSAYGVFEGSVTFVESASK